MNTIQLELSNANNGVSVWVVFLKEEFIETAVMERRSLGQFDRLLGGFALE